MIGLIAMTGSNVVIWWDNCIWTYFCKSIEDQVEEGKEDQNIEVSWPNWTDQTV